MHRKSFMTGASVFVISAMCLLGSTPSALCMLRAVPPPDLPASAPPAGLVIKPGVYRTPWVVPHPRKADEWFNVIIDSGGSWEGVEMFLKPDEQYGWVSLRGYRTGRLDSNKGRIAFALADRTANGQEVVKLNQELTRAKLDRIAILVNRVSEGKSALLIGKGVGANPRVGHVARDVTWGNTPAITVYPVSAPVRTKLDGIGEGKILGAVNLLVPASPPDGKERPEAGVYIIFQRIPAGFGAFEVSTNYTSLVSMAVDGEGRIAYKEVLKSPMLSHEAEEGSPVPSVTVEFPDRDSVSSANPAWRVKVGMKWMEDLYRFHLDLGIEMT